MALIGSITILLVLFHFSAQQSITPVLDISTGPIYGSVKSMNGQTYEEYLGIPFAAPPVGALRFVKPAPVQSWVEPLNCTHYSPSCTDFLANFYPFIGLSGENGEDCLYVNVWVPNGVQANQGRQLPVMVFVYGGGFNIGTGEMYPGNALAVHGDIIVVNFNYRIGIFGFLSTGDSEAPGNYGLWDQKAALEWVQQNIATFNGDPTKVTIFGQSAGATSVSHLMISPYTQGLFQGVIAVSGSSSASWGTTSRGLDSAIVTAQFMNCSASSSKEIVDCLRGLDARELDFWSSIGLPLKTGEVTSFSPVIDGDFVPRPPQESFKMGIGSNINFMTGSAFHDSAGFVIGNPIAFPPLGDLACVTRTNETMWAAALGSYRWTENPVELFSAVISMYPDINTEDYVTRTMAYTKSETDDGFGAFSNWEAIQHANSGGTGKTYQYVFHYRQSFLYGYPEWINGSHLDDVYSFLGEAFMEDYRRVILKAEFDELDTKVSHAIMDYYTNFATSGDPNVGPKSPEVHWEEFNSAEQNFLHQSNNFEMRSFYEQNTVDLYRFWTEVFPTLVIPKPPATYPTPTDFPVDKFTDKDIELILTRIKNRCQRLIPVPEAWKEINKLADQCAANRYRRH